MNKIKKKDFIVYMTVGLLLAVAISMLMSVKVQSRTQESLLFDNRAYESSEVRYKEQVQSLLESYGCYNSGLTLTRVVSLDGERTYQIQICNAKLRTLTTAAFAGLQEEIGACCVALPGGESYEVEVSFLK